MRLEDFPGLIDKINSKLKGGSLYIADQEEKEEHGQRNLLYYGPSNEGDIKSITIEALKHANITYWYKNLCPDIKARKTLFGGLEIVRDVGSSTMMKTSFSRREYNIIKKAYNFESE